MKLSLTLAVALLFAPTLFAQTSATQTVTETPDKGPLGSLTVGYTYLWADQGGSYRANLNGWVVRPVINVGRGFSIFFSNTNYYGHNAKGEVNSHSFTLGVAKKVFKIPRAQPNIFLEAGDVRASSHGITEEALVATGVGLSIPLAHRLALSITPAEYVFLYPHADWRNDYNAKVGLSFPFGHR